MMDLEREIGKSSLFSFGQKSPSQVQLQTRVKKRASYTRNGATRTNDVDKLMKYTPPPKASI